MTLKSWLKAATPPALIAWRRDRINAHWRRRFKTLSTQETFTAIYEHRLWGAAGDPNQPYCSGTGSQDAAIVDPYVAAVSTLLQGFARPPNVVDIGCGDFLVGSRLRPLCARYIACDIVAPLIAWNRQRYAQLDVDFRVLDAVVEPLPEGDVVFLRQVLQHLSNDQIARVVDRVAGRYDHLVLTEHVPATPSFKANLDKPAGSDTRIDYPSGVVLTEPPFSMPCLESRVICEVPEYNAIVRTLVYRLR